MAYVHLLKDSFNAGEISPLLTARVSAPVHINGCAKLENFIPRVQGGITKRPGFAYVGAPKGTASQTRLFGFKRSTDINYMLELGNLYIRIWSGGTTPAIVPVTINTTPGTVVPDNANPWLGSSSGGAWVTTTSYALNAQVTSFGTVFRCREAHTSSTQNQPGARAEHRWGRYWREIPFYQIGDIVSNGGDAYYCKTRHYPSASFATDAAYWDVMVDIPATSTAVYEIPTPYLASELDRLKFCQLNDVLFIAHPNHPPARLTRRGENNWEFVEVPFKFAPVLDLNESLATVQVQYDGVPAFGLPWVTATAYADGDRVHGTGAGVVGRVYQCKLGHTSSAAGAGGNEPGIGATWATYWDLVSSSGYAVGDRVTGVDVTAGTPNPLNGQIFTCHTAYNPGSTSNDEPGLGSAWQDYWNEGTSKVAYADWAANVSYDQGDKVRVKKGVYECIRAHKSASATSNSGSGGRVAQVVTPGNKPGSSGTWVRYWRLSAADTDLNGLSFALFSSEDLFTSDDVGTIWQLEFGAGGIVEEITVPTLATPAAPVSVSSENNPLFIQGGYTVNTTWLDGEAPIGTITIEESLDGVTWGVVRQFTQVNAKDGNISYSGDAPSVGAWYRISLKTTSNQTSSKIKIEATSSIYRLPFKITSYEETTKVLGNLIMPGDQLPPAIVVGVATSLFRQPAFSETNGYPTSVAFHESRLWWGGTASNPTRIWASQTEDFYIYLTGSLDTDGLDLSLAAVEANQILWMTSFNRALVIGTSGDEWTVDSGETDEALKPSNVRARRRTRYGSSGAAPILTGDALLWVQRGGCKIREFAYVFQKDAFEAPDMTAFADHIIGNTSVGATSTTIRAMALQTSPEPVMWVIDGTYLYTFSYNREQEVTAWAKHSLDGTTVSGIGIMYNTSFITDEVWIVGSSSNIEGSNFIARLNLRTAARWLGPSRPSRPFESNSTFFSDFSIAKSGTYNAGTNRTEFTGLDHFKSTLSASDFRVFTIKGVYTPVTWTGGVLSVAGNINVSATIGIPYESVVTTNEAHFQLANGTTFARNMRPDSVDLCLYKSYGGEVGMCAWTPPSATPSNEMQDIRYKEEHNEDPLTDGVEIGFTGKTGDQSLTGAGWTRSLRIQVTHSEPTPFNLLSLVLKAEVEET